MIEGLKLTMTGEELRKRLDERVKDHERAVEHYKRERRAKDIGGSSSGAYAIAEALTLQQEKKPSARRREPQKNARAATRDQPQTKAAR